MRNSADVMRFRVHCRGTIVVLMRWNNYAGVTVPCTRGTSGDAWYNRVRTNNVNGPQCCASRRHEELLKIPVTSEFRCTNNESKRAYSLELKSSQHWALKYAPKQLITVFTCDWCSLRNVNICEGLSGTLARNETLKSAAQETTPPSFSYQSVNLRLPWKSREIPPLID